MQISPGQAEVWHESLLKRVSQATADLQREVAAFQKAGEATIVLDGTTYELRLRQNTTEVCWELIDEEVNDSRPAGRSPVARWMNEVRRYALAHAGR